ncbi:MAG: Rho termination factor N-terminal domain-containing protein [Chloroflexota bacterium]
MTKAELESKHIAELHTLAAEAGLSGYRMMRREELIEKLADEKPARPSEGRQRERGERPQRRRRERKPRQPAKPEPKGEERKAPKPEPKAKQEPARPESAPAPAARPRRRRRRFGRRRKGVGPADLLLPPAGRQTLVYGESRESCTALLREIAAELSGGKGPDPIALLVDPSPEELADWRREAPGAEIVAAGKARHASDALAQAVRRAEGGEDVIFLIDSLSRLEDAGAAQEIFDGGQGLSATGSLTVVAALERPA